MDYNAHHNNGQRWWKAPEDQLHNHVFPYIQGIQSNQSYKSSDNLRHARLYGNYEMVGLDSYSYSRVEQSYNTSHRVTLNIIQSLIDTVVAKITKNKPKPTFLTDNGDWKLQQKAKKLNKFIEGLFYSCNFYDQATQAFTDACIFGTGAIKIFKEEGEIKAERVFIEELIIDDVEGYYSEPRQIHQKKYIHKDVLKEMFPEYESAIEDATKVEDKYSTSMRGNQSDMVQVIESWHLKSGPNAKDGIHSLTIANKTLFSEEYTKDTFPFVFFRWNKKPVGFFGQGLSEQLQGIQLEINKILRTIQVSMHLVSVPKLLVEASSKIVTAHLNNKIGGVIKYAGTPPQYAPLGGVPSELFSHLDRLFQRGYEISGVSQLSAQSSKPAGLNSGKALRTYNDLETERFLTVAKRYEQTFLDAAKIMVSMARDMYEAEEILKVKVKGQSFIETIEWKDVDIEEDKYMMSIFPTSALSTNPSARLDDVQELLQAGFISKEEGMKLLDFPDLKSTMSYLNSALEDIERMIESMISQGKYETPEPYQNLELGIQKCQQAYLLYKSQNAPDERLELLRRWIEDANALLEKAAQAAVPQQNAPLANPTPTPTSELLPNVPTE